MKVLHVFKTYYPDTHGGTEQFIHQLTKATANMGVDNTVFTLSSKAKGFTFIKGIRVFQALKTAETFNMPWSISGFFDFRKIARQHDLIHFHHPWPFADLMYLFFLRGKPAIVTYHLDLVRSKPILIIYSILKKLFFKYLQTIVVTSDAYGKSSQQLLNYENKLQVIPIGIDEKDYPLPSNSLVQKWRETLGDDFILFIGAFRYYKGLHDLIYASLNSKCKIVLLGDGPMWQDIHDLVIKLKITSQVLMLGALDDLDKMAILTLAKGLVLPSNSRAEAFGICLLEGMMLSKPLISTELSTGTSWVNQHGVTGLVVPPCRPDLLAHALNWIIANPQLAKEMGKQGRARFDSLFNAKSMALAYFKVYTKILVGQE
jgi:rhamnosyl/mannosyltransferase